MASYYNQPPPQSQSAPYNPQQNLQFYPSSYPNAPVSGHTTPSQAQYGNSYGQPSSAYPNYGGYGAPGSSTGPGFGGAALPSGRMGEQGGLRTGWLAAFGTEGYDGEPPLLEELGVNFGHIKSKVPSTKSYTPSLHAALNYFFSAPSDPVSISPYQNASLVTCKKLPPADD